MKIDPHELLAPYLDGAVSEAERLQVERALAGDPVLRQTLEALRETTAFVQTEADTPELWTDEPGPPAGADGPSFLASVRARIAQEEASGWSEEPQGEDEGFLWPRSAVVAEATSPAGAQQTHAASVDEGPTAAWEAIRLPGQEAPGQPTQATRPDRGARAIDFLSELPTADLPTPDRPSTPSAAEQTRLELDQTTEVIRLRPRPAFARWGTPAAGLLAACIAVGLFLQRPDTGPEQAPVAEATAVADAGPATAMDDSEIFRNQVERAQDVLDRTRRQEEELRAELEVAMTARGRAQDQAEADGPSSMDAEPAAAAPLRLRNESPRTASAEAVGRSAEDPALATSSMGRSAAASAPEAPEAEDAVAPLPDEQGTPPNEPGYAEEERAAAVTAPSDSPRSSARRMPAPRPAAAADDARESAAEAAPAPTIGGTQRSHFGGISSVPSSRIPSRLSTSLSLKVGSIGGRVRTVQGVGPRGRVDIMEVAIRDFRRESFESWLGRQGADALQGRPASSMPGWTQYRLELVP